MASFRSIGSWKKNEPALDVIVPIEKKYQFDDLTPGNYVILLRIGDEFVLESKCHVRGNVLEPTEGLPFRAELRLELPYSENMDTGFILVGDFPDSGFAFTEKKVEIVDDQITVIAKILQTPSQIASFVTPYKERIGVLSIPDLWKRPYYATAVVNDVTLETIKFGGSLEESPFSHPWNWIEVRAETPVSENSEMNLYLIGEFPTPGYQLINPEIDIVDGQINVRVEILSPTGEQDLVITPFRESVGSLLIDENWMKTDVVNLYVNNSNIGVRNIDVEAIDTSVQNWNLF